MRDERVISDAQRQGVERLRDDHRRIAAAIDALEHAVGAPFPHRMTEWLVNVRTALGQFRRAVGREYRREADPTGILEKIRISEPRLANDIDAIEQQYEDLAKRSAELAEYLEHTDPQSLHIHEVRERLSDLLSDYRQLQAREVDVIYDAFQSDIGVGD